MGTRNNDGLTPEQFKKWAKLTRERDQLQSKMDELEFVSCALIVAMEDLIKVVRLAKGTEANINAYNQARAALRRARAYDESCDPGHSGSELNCDWCGQEVINGEGRYPENEDGALDDRVCADCDHLRKSVYGLRSRALNLITKKGDSPNEEM